MKGIPISAVLLAVFIGACELLGHLEKNTTDIDLVDTMWMLSSFEIGDVKSDKGCAVITLTFTEDGEVRGTSERNSFFGLYYTGRADSLSIRGKKGARHLGSTRVGEPSCSRYEEHLLTLSAAISYRIDGDKLNVVSENGTTLHYDIE